MYRADSEILAALEGSGEVVAKLSFYSLRRNGHLLLGIPKDRIMAKLTLNLYQPQSSKAKFTVRLIKLMVGFRIHWLLPTVDLCIKDSSPIAKLNGDSREIGFLLGNPEAESRRTIVSYYAGDNFEVAKIGIGSAAKISVLNEAKTIELIPLFYTGVVRSRRSLSLNNWFFYSTDFVRGIAPKKQDDSLVLALLTDWMKHFEKKRVSEISVWNDLVEMVKHSELKCADSVLKQLSNMEIMVGLYHGDFAPWNIKISDNKKLHVMDWENAILDGLAGWDWIHYLIRRSILVDGATLFQALESCVIWAKSVEGRIYLIKSGWGENIDLWMGSYIIYNSISHNDADLENNLDCLNNVMTDDCLKIIK